MKQKELTVSAEELRTWLEENQEVIVLDVRPKSQREEWQIPGSKYIDAYEQLKNNDPGVLDEIDIPQNSKVVTVCALGKTSQIAATELRKRGIEAYSLEGGMKSWSTAWNTAKLNFPDLEIIQIRRTGKGCLSYIISSYNEAVVVDASLPVEIYERIINQNNLSLKYVIETHIHADHLSRSKQLAERSNVPLYLPATNKLNFQFYPINNTTVFQVGEFIIKPIQTPGHTVESISFIVGEKALLTGDTLFVNGVGRPDLKAGIGETKQKARLLYQSLQKLLMHGDNMIVLPAHTSEPVDFNNVPVQSTLGEIRINQPMLQLSEEKFISALFERIPPTPANYLLIVEKNMNGDFSDIIPDDLEAGANRCAIT